jgi:hypothetical protein
LARRFVCGCPTISTIPRFHSPLIYRAILRQQISATLDDPTDADVEDEIRALFAALG